MVKIDTGKAGTGHRKTFKNDKEEKVLNTWHFPGGSVVKNLPEMQGTRIQSPGSARSPRGGNSHTFQYSCLENSMDRGAWQATLHGISKSRT